MPEYVDRALQRFEHPTPTRNQHSPHQWDKPIYGAPIQLAQTDDTSDLLAKDDKVRVQAVLGTLLFYARAVDFTMLKAIGTIATQQATPTRHTLEKIVWLLNYAATYPNAIVRYTASDMILFVESDASYLNENKARSTASGYHYLSSPSTTDAQPQLNGPIHVLCQILKEVCSSAAEAELAALFHNGKEASYSRMILQALDHKQPPTELVTDNSTAHGITNDTVKQKRSKAMDMRYYWICDRVRQNQFTVSWRPGITNHADPWSKHHAPTVNRQIRHRYLINQPHPVPDLITSADTAE